MKYSDLSADRILKRLLAFFFFLLIFLSFMKPVIDPDTPWHLKTGEHILLHKAIPTSDPFSFAEDSLPFIGKFILTQYWLAQIIFSLVYKYGGTFGLALMSATILTFLAGLLRYLIRNKGFYLSFLITGVFVYFMREFQGVRPQLFTFLFSGFVIFLFEKYKEKGNMTFLFPLIFLMPLWSNLHGGYIYGVVLIVIYSIAEIIQSYIGSWQATPLPERLSKNQRYCSLAIVVIAILFSMANPNMYKAFFYAFTTHSKDLFSGIYEYQSPFQLMKSSLSPLLYGFLLFIIASIVMIVIFIKRRDVTPLLLLVFSVIPAMVSIRYIAFLFIVSTAMFRYIPLEIRAELATKMRLAIHLVLLIASSALMLIINPLKDNNMYKFSNNIIYAVSASDFLLGNRISGNIFSSYNKSSYLLFRLFPESRLYSDSRFLSSERIRTSSIIEGDYTTVIEVLNIINKLVPKQIGTIEISSQGNGATPEVANSTELPSRNISPRSLNWENSLDTIKADIIVHEAVNMYSGHVYPFIFNLIQDESWKLIYADGNVLIFVRDIQKYKNIIIKYNKPKSAIYDEIITESMADKDTPGYYSSTALAMLLRGSANENTYALIEKALARDPGNVLAHYANALYLLMDKARKKSAD